MPPATKVNKHRKIPSTLQLTCNLNIKAARGKGKSGPTRFTLVASTGEPMKLPGFIDPVVIDFDTAEFAKEPTPVIYDHDTALRIGHTTETKIDDKGIRATGIVSSSMNIANGFVEDCKAGYPFEVSVGASVGSSLYIDEDNTIELNGREYDGPIIVAKNVKIKELSVTVLGADGNTSVLVAAFSEFNKHHQREKGTIMRKTRTRNIDRNSDDTIDVERSRIKQINAMLSPPKNSGGWDNVQNEVDDIRAKAIDGELSLSDLPYEVGRLAELQAIRADRGFDHSNGGYQRFNRGADSVDTLEAALAMHAGLRNLDKHYDEQTLDSAERLNITSMYDIGKAIAEMSGKSFDGRNKDSVIRATFSTNEFPTLVSNVANKTLQDAYRVFPSAAKVVAKKLTAENFKEHTGVRLTGDATMLQLAGDGELKFGTLDDQSFTYSIGTYGRMFGIDRQTLINDDLSALQSVPQLLGRGGALALEEGFWKLVLANTGSFFHTSNGNVISGADSALDADALATAVKVFLEQTDTKGKPISAMPRYLAVPPALKTLADELFASRTFGVGGGSTTASDRVTNVNAFFGLYQPVVSPWISTDALSGSSDTQWYLFGDPQDIAAFGIAYLNGNEMPTIETVDQPANKLGITFRGYFDFGIAQIDHRGAVKSVGA